MDIANNKNLFITGEKIAQAYLESKGYLILSKNFRRRTGEIDIIAKDKDKLVFVEVKTRSYHSISLALASVSFTKQKRITRCAIEYISQNPAFDNLQTRFDVIIVLYNAKDNDYSVKHFIDAFLPVIED